MIILKENETLQDLIDRLTVSFDMVYNIAPVAYWYETLQDNGHVKEIHFSQRMREMLGYKSVEEFPDELNTLMTFTHPDDVHIMLDGAIAAAMGKIEKYDVQYRIRSASGDYVWCNATGIPVKDSSGKTIGMYGAFIDITEEIELRDRQEAQRHVEAIIKGVSAKYVVVYMVNMADDSFRLLRMDEGMYGGNEQFANFSEAKEYFISTVVAEEDQEKIRREMDYAVIRRKLLGTSSYGVAYRPAVFQFMDWYEMRITRIDDDRVVFAFCEITDEYISGIVNETLVDKYDALYLVDLNKDEIRPARPSRVSDTGAIKKNMAFSELARNFAETVAPKYKQDWLNFSNPAYMKKYMADENQREYIYELPGTEKSLRRFTVDVLERIDGEAAVLLLSFEGIDDTRAQTILLHRQMAEQSIFTNYLLGTYTSAYYVGLEDLSCQVYKRTDELEKEFPITTNYLDAINEHIAAVVHPDDKAELEKLVRPENIKKALQAKNEIAYSFRVNTPEEEKVYRLQVIRGADENHAALGFADITEELRKETDEILQQELIKQMAGDEGLFIIDCVRDTRTTVHDRTYGSKNYNDNEKYSVAVSRYIDNFVSAADKEMMREVTSLSYMLERANKEREYTVEYRENTTGIQRFYEMKVVKFSDTAVLQSFSGNDKEYVDRVLLQNLKDDYFGLYGIDLDAGLMQTIKKIPWYDTGETGDVIVYSAAMKEFTGLFEGEVRRYFEKVSDIGFLRKRFTGEDKATFNFKTDRLEGDKWINVSWHVAGRHKNGMPSILTLGFSVLDSDASERKELLGKVQESLTFTNYFLKQYQSVYYMDMDNLSFKVLQRDAEIEANYPVVASYLDSLKDYIRKEVHPQDHVKFAEALNPQRVKEILAEKPEFSFNYRRIYNGKESIFQAKVLRGGDAGHACFGFREVTEEVRLQVQQQKTDDIINSFANDYIAAFMVDLTDDSYVDISGKDKILRQMTDITTFSDKVKRYVERYVHPSDRGALSVFDYNPKVVRQKLALGETVSVEYRSNYKTGDYLWYRMAINRVGEDAVLVGFKDCDEEILSRFVKEKLLGKYDALYYVDLNEDIIRPVHTVGASSVGSFTQTLRYGKMARRFAETVAPKYRQDWLNFSDTAFMKNYMAEADQREFIYELPEMDKILRRCTIDVIDRVDGEAATIIMAFEGIDDVRAQAILLHQKMAESARIIGALSDDFFCVNYVEFTADKKNDTIVGYRTSELMKKHIPGWEKEINFSNRIGLLIRYLIYEPDKKEFFAATRREKILEKLQEDNLYYINTRFVIDNEARYYQLKISAVREEEKLIGLVMGIHSVDEEMRKDQKHQEELEKALAEATLANQRNDLLHDIIHSGKWSFGISADDKVESAYVSKEMLNVLNAEVPKGPYGWTELVHPEDRERAVAEFKAAIADHSGRTLYDTTYRMVDRHGEYHWFRSAGRIIRNEDGSGEFFGMHVNINNRIEAEQKYLLAEKTEIQLKHEHLRSEVLSFMIDNDDDPIELLKKYAEQLRLLISCDQVIYRDLEETRIMVNSPAIEETWSVPIEYCQQCQHFDAHHPMYAGGYTEMANCQEGWQGIPVYEKCPIKSSLTRIVYCDNEIAGYLAIHYVQDYHQFTDIERSTVEEFTRILSISLSRYEARKENKELKVIAEMQEQLKEALALAESANRAKSTFLFNMSHDIRTPMNAIIGYTDVALRHFDDADKAKASLKKIKSSSEHLLSLINDILEMSRIESGKLEITEAPLYIHKAIEGVAQMSEVLAIPKSIKFVVNTGEIKNPYIYADELRIDEVLINIISNAMKYSHEDGRVSFSVSQLGDAGKGKAWYRFEVADNGIGMSEEFQKHIFESFSREKSSTVSHQEGAGLGMAIVKRVIDLKNGKIDIKSKPGEGTTVVIEVPFRVMDEAAVTEFVAAQAGEKKIGGNVSLEGKRVLLVEDNEMNREIAEEILKESGLVVETAEDGDIAVRMFSEKGRGWYDFVLMDIQMPNMNGYDATRAIRKLPGGDIVPIIALSANAFAEDKQKSFEAGMDEHIAKPIDVQELFETLKKAAGR